MSYFFNYLCTLYTYLLIINLLKTMTNSQIKKENVDYKEVLFGIHI